MKIKVNAKELLRKLIEKDLSVAEAAKLTGLTENAFYTFVKEDKGIRYKTARILRKEFGDEVIYFADDKG